MPLCFASASTLYPYKFLILSLCFQSFAVTVFKIVYVVLIVGSAVIENELAWELSDTANALMAMPNLVAVVLLSGTVVKITKNYYQRQRGEKVEPMLSAYPDRNAEFKAELEAEKDQKKVSTPTVIVVFVLFFALAAGVVLGTNQFNYSQVIKKAANYFERHRYRLAYDEVSGVEVKEKDQDLKDRIYTVMYVERLYESYENNMKLGRADKALDALLRGIQKYDEHYDEAVELDIVKDIDSCRDKIINALWNTYGITEETAYQILAMEGQEYTKTLSELGAKAAETETPTDAQGQ
mgnify:CR=1 FL=1